MTSRTANGSGDKRIAVRFVGLGADEVAPAAALYQLDRAGRPQKKLATIDNRAFDAGVLGLKISRVGIGPDAKDFATLDPQIIASYWLEQVRDLWSKEGALIPREIWDRFYFEYVCVTGSARKCRPWWWDIGLRPGLLRPLLNLPLTVDLHPQLLYPIRCQPLCDGVVEIFERECCCERIDVPSILDGLRDLLDDLPIPIPDPIPDPFPGPWPGPGPDPAPFDPAVATPALPATLEGLRGRIDLTRAGSLARQISLSKTVERRLMAAKPAAGDALPSQRLYEDYLALASLRGLEAERYVMARPYLTSLCCSCHTRKVGEAFLQPGGRFDFCYSRSRLPVSRYRYCHLTYAYRIKQNINGTTVVVYDGVAKHDWFAGNQPAVLTTADIRALICDDGDGDRPPAGVKPMVMLEYVTHTSTHHFNFPAQNGESAFAALSSTEGLFQTSYADHCPWGGALGLRLWIDDAMEGIAKYYRFSVARVNDSGTLLSTLTPLVAPVAWSYLKRVGPDVFVASEGLGADPSTVGGKAGLFVIPYRTMHAWLTGQPHQAWVTPDAPDEGRWALFVELFDGTGNLIKPDTAPGGEAGTAKAFEYRRWSTTATATAIVDHAKLGHLFWVDNTPVVADIIDLRQDGTPSVNECQFKVGPAATRFSIGYRAYHVHGLIDADSFMLNHSVSWQRGLNGASGSLAVAVPSQNSGGTLGVVYPPNSSTPPIAETVAYNPPTTPAQTAVVDTFGELLQGRTRCTFSVTLYVRAKHFNGSSRLLQYDRWETASFALEIGP